MFVSLKLDLSQISAPISHSVPEMVNGSAGSQLALPGAIELVTTLLVVGYHGTASSVRFGGEAMSACARPASDVSATSIVVWSRFIRRALCCSISSLPVVTCLAPRSVEQV